MAVGVVVLMLSGTASPIYAASSNVTAPPRVSYNPGAASVYHAPVSGMGLVAITRSFTNHFGTNSSLTPPGISSTPQGVPAGLTRFINDSSYAPQSETSVAANPANTQQVVGTYNDGRWFFCPDLRAQDCPDGYTKSVTGFTTSVDGGKTVQKSNDLPGLTMTEKNLTSGLDVQGFMLSWGDPSVAPAPDGTFYAASLAIDPNNGPSGIMIEKSNSNLFSPGSTCTTSSSSPDTNPCWTAHLVYGNLSFQCNFGACGQFTFEDKDTLVVDSDPGSPFFGYAYVAWDHFYSSGQSSSYVALCSPSLSCTMVSGGTAPVVSSTDPYVAYSTPAVGTDGTIYVSWCDFGTATTYGPVYCSVRSSSPGGSSFGTVHSVLSYMGTGTQLAGDTVIVGFATEQFRAASELTLVAGAPGDVYFAVPLCVSGFYYRFNNLQNLPSDNPGDCGKSAVFFVSSTDGGASWSSPDQVSVQAVVIQPTLAYDSKTGAVILAYYTSQFDPFSHRLDVGVALSSDKGNTFSFVRGTTVSNEPTADPANYDYIAPNGFGGSFVVPQYGDYFTAWAYGGRVWVLFSGNYAQVQGTYKVSPFLAVLGEAPSSLNLSSNARDAAPGDKVTFSTKGFTAGSTLTLSMLWNGVIISLANSTVSSSGTATGSFTVPNVQSQVYTVVADDGTGLTSTASLGVGQVSLSGVQSTLASLQGALNSLGGTVSGGFSSLNANIGNSTGTLRSAISAVGTSVNKALTGSSSTLSTVEDITIAIFILLVVLLILQFVLRRGHRQAPQASPQSPAPPVPGPGTGAPPSA